MVARIFHTIGTGVDLVEKDSRTRMFRKMSLLCVTKECVPCVEDNNRSQSIRESTMGKVI